MGFILAPALEDYFRSDRCARRTGHLTGGQPPALRCVVSPSRPSVDHLAANSTGRRRLNLSLVVPSDSSRQPVEVVIFIARVDQFLETSEQTGLRLPEFMTRAPVEVLRLPP